LQRAIGNRAGGRMLGPQTRREPGHGRGETAARLQVSATGGRLVQANYLADVAGSFGWYLFSLVGHLPQHIWDIGAEVVRAVVAGFHGNWSELAVHLGRALINGLAWPMQLIAKILDVVGFGEFMDLMMQVVKQSTRPLNAAELAAAQGVFGTRINYGQVRVDEHSLLNTHVFRFWAAFTSWHTINWPAGHGFHTDPGTFIHEMTHVWQMERRGAQYIAEAPYHGGLSGGGYVYGVDRSPWNGANHLQLQADRANGKTIWDFNLEQQAEICNHDYVRQQAHQPVQYYQPFIDDIQGINAMPLRVWIRQPD
jgi:hypothetical protein